MMFEHAVQADDGDRFLREQLIYPLELRQAVGDAAGAQHLEGADRHHAAAQRRERQRRAVEPARNVEFGGRAHSGRHRPFQ